MVYQSMIYISEYLSQLALPDINVPFIWDVDSNNKYVAEVFLGKGRMRKVKCDQTIEISYNILHYIISISYLFNVIHVIHQIFINLYYYLIIQLFFVIQGLEIGMHHKFYILKIISMDEGMERTMYIHLW